MKIGSKVYIISGPHKGLEGTLVKVLRDQVSTQRKLMGDVSNQDDGEIEDHTYVQVELSLNHSIIEVKRKRLILLSEKSRLSKSDK